MFARGNSIGTTTVNGALTFMPGSIYQVKTNAAGSSDRINVVGAPGTATLNGGTVDVLAGSGTYQPLTQYTILNSQGGVTGHFTDVTSNLAFLTPTLGYDQDNVFLTLKRNNVSYGSVGVTPNQIAVGTALQSAMSGAQGNVLALLTAVNNLSAAQAPSALNQLAGEIHASAQTVMLEESRFVREAGMDRVRLEQDGAMPGAAGGGTAWANILGGDGHFDGNGNASRLHHDTVGFLAGADTTLAAGWLVGGLLGYSRTDLDTEGLNSSAETNNYHVGVYGGTRWGATGLRLGASYSWDELDTQRNVSFQGLADDPAGQVPRLDHAGVRGNRPKSAIWAGQRSSRLPAWLTSTWM